jgi:hypothetical protein
MLAGLRIFKYILFLTRHKMVHLAKKLFTIKNTGLTVSRATAMQKDVGMPVTLRIWAKTGMVGRAL